jgi:hypothetical protein
LAPGVTRVGVVSSVDASFKRADKLDAAAVLALHGWSASKVALWCGLFGLVVIGSPVVGLWQRRRRRAALSTGPTDRAVGGPEG